MSTDFKSFAKIMGGNYILLYFCCSSYISFNPTRRTIVIRNGKIFLYNLSSEPSLHESASNINKQVRWTIKQFKVKWLSSCFVLNLRMSGENCLNFNWHSSRAAPGISCFTVPTKDDECSINWRNNIVAVITVDTIRWWGQFKKTN